MISNIPLNCCFLPFDWPLFWSFATAVATIGLVIVGYVQLRKINETNRRSNEISQENFLYKLKGDFFTKNARDLLILIEEGALSFMDLENGNATFEITIEDGRKVFLKQSIDTERKYYTTHEIDDFLLNPLEDIGLLLEKSLIDIKDVTQNFEYYLNAIFSCAEITKYINWARIQANDNDIYSKAEWAYHSVEAHDKRPKKANV